jgi:hypothetical protein
MAVNSQANGLLTTRIMGTLQRMYIHSHLGLGLMAGRAALLSHGLVDGDARLRGETSIEYGEADCVCCASLGAARRAHHGWVQVALLGHEHDLRLRRPLFHDRC